MGHCLFVAERCSKLTPNQQEGLYYSKSEIRTTAAQLIKSQSSSQHQCVQYYDQKDTLTRQYFFRILYFKYQGCGLCISAIHSRYTGKVSFIFFSVTVFLIV